MTDQTTTNGEAMTPAAPQTTVALVGEVVHAFAAHGVGLERRLEQAEQGARNLGLQLRMAHKAMDEGERRIGELQDKNGRMFELLVDAFALLGKGFCFGNGQITPEWQSRVQAWADRFNEAGLFATVWHLTDEHKLPPVHVDDDLGEDTSDLPTSPAAG